MTVVLIMIGTGLIVMALHDIFHTLFHPAGRGTMSDWLGGALWRMFRALDQGRRGLLAVAGPWIFISVIFAWAALVVMGFTLIYYTGIGGEFATAPGMNPAQHKTFFDAFNISLGALITLGGDFNSQSKLLRLGMGVEAVIGFGLLTASVSWLLSIYPVLEERRSLAHKASLLHYAHREMQLPLLAMERQEVFDTLMEITAEMIGLRNSLAQFPISYYFQAAEKETALPGILEYLRGMAERATASQEDCVRLAGTVLGGAIESYLKLVADVYLRMPTDDTPAVLRAYANDHRREIVAYDA